MLLETLLMSPCFLSGKTSFTDEKTTLTVLRQDIKGDETLLFFNIDNQSCKLREFFWNAEKGHPLCDLLVFFAKGDERIFCFVELKGNREELPQATKQVISTCEVFKKKFPVQFSAKSFICYFEGELPREHQRYQKNLKAVFGSNFELDGKSENFLNFLRGENGKYKKRGQKK